jgi:hypothetical protein
MNVRGATHRLVFLAVATFLSVSAASGASVQSVCAVTGFIELPIQQPFATDPAMTGFPPVTQPRCITGPGAVSSSLTQGGRPGVVDFAWDARTTISVDPSTGVLFSGFAQVSFPGDPPNIGLGAIAEVNGSFLDKVTISAPGVSGQGVFVIPLHVTGAVSAVGTVAGSGIPHTGELTYSFLSAGLTSFGRAQGTVGLSTTNETLVCGPAACGVAPVLFDQTVLVQLPFTFGEQFDLSGTFGVDASFFLNAATGGILAGSTTADFSHTLTLGPATVTDASGNPILGVTIASDIDYLAGTIVPEPSAAALLTATLMGAVGIRRKVSRAG